jgi:hypothetical protein
LICTDRMSGFMGPVFKVVCWRENDAAPDDDRAERSLGVKTSSREQGPRFNLVGTSQTIVVRETRGATRMVVIRETRGATHMTCQSGSSPAGCTPIRTVMTLSDMSDRLSLLPSHSMSYCIWMVGSKDGYGYDYHGYYWYTCLIMLLINLMMLVLCKL